MLRKAPPLESVEIFVLAAKAPSFRAVARELALSPSAISRRIARLEVFLGVELFDRSGPGRRLTTAGRRYLAAVAPAVAVIRDAAGELEVGGGRLRVAASHSFASNWLIRRLPGLAAEHGVEVEVIPTRDPEALHSGEAHLAIWGGLTAPEGVLAEDLSPSSAAPVSAASLADGRPAPRTTAELVQRTLIEVTVPGAGWSRWFAASGLALRPSEIRIAGYPTQQLAFEAAAAGLGVALASPLVSEPYVPARGLIPCGAARSIGGAYRLCRSSRRRAWSQAERRFAAWLRQEVVASVDRFGRDVAAPATR